uniref:Uncharacterized protein n=1 Tax=Ciona intestinalis TaxID=7719 RepID=H2Y303_CIOIN
MKLNNGLCRFEYECYKCIYHVLSKW